MSQNPEVDDIQSLSAVIPDFALFLGVVITVCSIVRSVQAQIEMEGKISDAVARGMNDARKLEGPHIRIKQYAPRPFVAGQPPQINMVYVNDGPVEATIKTSRKSFGPTVFHRPRKNWLLKRASSRFSRQAFQQSWPAYKPGTNRERVNDG